MVSNTNLIPNYSVKAKAFTELASLFWDLKKKNGGEEIYYIEADIHSDHFWILSTLWSYRVVKLNPEIPTTVTDKCMLHA